MKAMLALALLPVAFACSAERESTIGRFGRVAEFPLYYMTGGDTPESGALYRVSEVSIGQVVGSELVATGFTAPGGLAQTSTGLVLVPQALAAPDGKILSVEPQSGTVREVLVDLDYPTGVAVDAFNQLYVIENGRRRVLKKDATGAVTVFKGADIGSPEVGVMDAADNLYLVESENDLVSRIDPSGVRSALTPAMTGIRDLAIDAAGVLHVLWVDADLGTGTILKYGAEAAAEAVVVDLINPLAIAFDSANALYVAEGAPENRISRLGAGELSRRVIVHTAGEPQALLFTPF